MGLLFREKEYEETRSPKENRRALNFESINSPTKRSNAMSNVDTSFEPHQSTSKETANNKGNDSIEKPKRILSMDSLSSDDFRRDDIGIVNNSESSHDERINDDHVFLRPKIYRKSRQRMDQYGFLDNSSAKKVKSRDMKTSKFSGSSSSTIESPWRRADQAAGEDLSWAPSNFERLHANKSSGCH